MRIALLSVSLLASGCTQDAIVDDPVVDQNGIVNGFVDEGHPSVGVVRQAGYGCTGTLIGPRTVLTAAHCLRHSDRAYFYDGVTLLAGNAIPHPHFAGGDWNYDVGILSLDSASSVAPTPISTAPTLSGQPITMVGFGRTSAEANDFGTKRYAQNTIEWVDGFAYHVPGSGGRSAICFGDSGGPDFSGRSECQIGVHSRTAYPACATYSITNRVDVQAGWILGTAGDSIATCVPPCEGGPIASGGFPSSGSLWSLSPSGSTVTLCGSRDCGDGSCQSCDTLALGGGATVTGAPFHGLLQSVTGRGSSLELCGWVSAGEYDAYGCVSWALAGASASGGLSGSRISGVTGSGSTIQLGGTTSCGGGDAEYLCAISGAVALTCAP
jgi:hypothetical protein